ncbi:MAG: hypothetical protein RIS35_2689, partial [Pseudomonadota bacterium]
RLEQWRARLAASGKALIGESGTLDRERATWQASRAALRDDAPPAVRERIDATVREIDAAGARVRDATASLIAAQGRLAAMGEMLERVRGELDAIRARSAQGLFLHDSPPLWTASAAHAASDDSLAGQAQAGWSRFRADAGLLLGTVRGNLGIHLTGFAAFFALLLLLRGSSRKAGEVQPSAAEHIVLDRSLFSALLLSLGLLPLLYPDLSPRVTRLVILPGLLAVLVLRRAVYIPQVRVGLYVFIATFLIDFVRGYLPPHWMLARLLLLVVSVLGAAGLVAVLLQGRVSGPRVQGVLRSLVAVALLLFLGSTVANLTGNLSLAEYLVSPPIRLAFLAVAIRLGVVATTTFAVMALRTPLAMSSRVIRERGKAAAIKTRRIIGIAGAFLWSYLALFNLGILASMQASVVALLKTEWHLGAAVISVRDLVTFVLVMVAAYVLSRALRLILAEEVFPRISFPRGVPDALVLVARYGVLLLGFLLALGSAGVDLSQVTLALSALGVGIGFGLQNVVNNFVCGLILVFEHPIQVGDYIEVGPHYGQVSRIGFRSCMLQTRDGSEVVIPNAELIGTKVVNWSLSDAIRRLNIPVPVSHGADTARVIEVLTSVACAHPLVCERPPPKAILDQIGDSALKFLLHCWVRTEHMPAVRAELTQSIDRAFRDAGIRIPYPQADVHLHFPSGAEGIPMRSSEETAEGLTDGLARAAR